VLPPIAFRILHLIGLDETTREQASPYVCPAALQSTRLRPNTAADSGTIHPLVSNSGEAATESDRASTPVLRAKRTGRRPPPSNPHGLRGPIARGTPERPSPPLRALSTLSKQIRSNCSYVARTQSSDPANIFHATFTVHGVRHPGSTVVLGRPASVRMLLGMRALVSRLVRWFSAAASSVQAQIALSVVFAHANASTISTGSVARRGATSQCLGLAEA
jgi:hypothetical protein